MSKSPSYLWPSAQIEVIFLYIFMKEKTCLYDVRCIYRSLLASLEEGTRTLLPVSFSICNWLFLTVFFVKKDQPQLLFLVFSYMSSVSLMSSSELNLHKYCIQCICTKTVDDFLKHLLGKAW